jgi:hypothetical protein
MEKNKAQMENNLLSHKFNSNSILHHLIKFIKMGNTITGQRLIDLNHTR